MLASKETLMVMNNLLDGLVEEVPLAAADVVVVVVNSYLKI